MRAKIPLSRSGSRLGGVIHDIYMIRRGEPTFVPGDSIRAIQREKLLSTVNILLTMIEELDDLEFANPRIGASIPPVEGCKVACEHEYCHLLKQRPRVYERCENIDHDRFGQRKTDCTECFPVAEQASLSTNLANLNEPPDSNPRIGTICACTDPVCNSDNNYPKACYACGGIKVKP